MSVHSLNPDRLATKADITKSLGSSEGTRISRSAGLQACDGIGGGLQATGRRTSLDGPR